MKDSVKEAVAAKRSLLTFIGVLGLLCSALQIFIALRGSHIDTPSTLLLGATAVYYFWYQSAKSSLLCKIRYGKLVAHLAGFLIVNLSYHVHAFVLMVTDNAAIVGHDYLPINADWFGVLFGMTTFWGVGLFIHLIASVANRGFEDAN